MRWYYLTTDEVNAEAARSLADAEVIEPRDLGRLGNSARIVVDLGSLPIAERRASLERLLLAHSHLAVHAYSLPRGVRRMLDGRGVPFGRWLRPSLVRRLHRPR